MRARIGAVGVVVFLLTALISAQTGEIAGVVRDASGGVLPGVTVEVSSPALIERVRATVTDVRGRYRIASLPAGTYSVAFTLTGFTTLRRGQVVVTPAGAVTVDAELEVGDLTETITVAAEAPVVDVSNARAMHVFPGGVARQRDVGWRRPRHGLPNTESYAPIVENVFRRVTDEPLSTFSIDVDTASYSNVRRFLGDGELPPPDAVRIEELVNYFRYDYPQPRGRTPFSVTTELTESPWNPAHRLVLIGLRGREIPDRDLPPRNLVFLIDVSGSMDVDDKLPLVQQALRLLVDTLGPRDRVAIVVYAGHSGLVLPSTPGDQRTTIQQAIARLHAGGSTNGGAGIQLAYQVAREHFITGGVNRVVLATDGDFNVGVTSHEALLRMIERERESGVFLSVLGVGMGNLKDDTMELLADKGNGNYAYLDSLQEARKVLVQEAGGTLVTIAKDVKVQVEFNPATVRAYRLIGYENRLLDAEDFNDDRKDAGEIGAGHSVTALYEIVPVGADDPHPVDPLRYQPVPVASAATGGTFPDELMTVKLRYKEPGEDRSRLITAVVRNRPQPMSPNVGFASAVAELGLRLRGSAYHAEGDFAALTARARRFRGEDADGYRAEFVRLADLAAGLRR